MPLDGVVAVTILGQVPNNQAASNTFHISNPASGAVPNLATLTQLAADLDTFLGTQYKAVLHTGSKYVSITCKQVPDPAIPHDPYEEYVLIKNVNGTRTVSDANVPEQACIVLSVKTPNAGRSYRGHMFLPPALDSGSLSGQFFNHSDTYYTASVAYAAKLAAGCGPTATWTGTDLPSYFLSIYSKTLQLAGKPSVSTTSAVIANDAVHWLRSRGRGSS